MKKIFFSLLFFLFAFVLKSNAQKISELSTSTGNRDSLYFPVLDGSTTKKVRGYKMRPKLGFNIVSDGLADTTGTTDASAIVQAAITGGYRDIVIPTGKFKWSSTVYLKDSVIIQGFGPSSVISLTGDFPAFKCRDMGAWARGTYNYVTEPDGKTSHGTASFTLGTGGGGYNTQFRNFSVLGNKAGTNQTGIRVDTANTITISNVQAYNLGGFLAVVNRNGVANYPGGILQENGVRGVRIENCYSEYCLGGVSLDTTAEYNTVANNVFVNGIYGVFERGANNIIIGNNLSTNFYGLRAIYHSSNNGHSAATGNIMNHCNHSLWLTGLTFGYYLSNNLMYSEDSIVIENCTHIEINGGFMYCQSSKPIVLNSNTDVNFINVAYFVGTVPVYSVTGTKPTITKTGKVANAWSLIDVVNAKQLDIVHTDGLVNFTGTSGIKFGFNAASPASTVEVNGSFATAYVAKSVDYTATVAENVIEVTVTGKTITLPTAVGITGRNYTIKLTASGTGTVATTSSQTIDGSTTYSLSAQYKYVTVQSNGANWNIIANN